MFFQVVKNRVYQSNFCLSGNELLFTDIRNKTPITGGGVLFGGGGGLTGTRFSRSQRRIIFKWNCNKAHKGYLEILEFCKLFPQQFFSNIVENNIYIHSRDMRVLAVKFRIFLSLDMFQ